MMIADKIRALRDSLGLTQPELARRVGADPSLVSRWEAGKQKPNAERLSRLADLAGVPMREFIHGKAASAARTFRVMGELCAGEWRAPWPAAQQYEVTLALPPGVNPGPMRGYVVRGGGAYPDGTIVFVARAKPAAGQAVVVRRGGEAMLAVWPDVVLGAELAGVVAFSFRIET
jgi:transcriptional regulator with XRE-family HTH domain